MFFCWNKTIVAVALVLMTQSGACTHSSGPSDGTRKNEITSETQKSKPVSEGKDRKSLSEEQTASDDRLIVPGKQVGEIYINADIEKVYDRLGKPDRANAAAGKVAAVWFGVNNSAGSLAVFSARDMGNSEISRIKLIRTSSPEFKTREGISVATDTGRIRRTFPDIKSIEIFQENGQKYTIYDSRAGIAFETNTKGLCSAVIIHDANLEVRNLHAKFDFSGQTAE